MVMNPMQFIQMLRGGGNPQAMVMNMLRQNAGQNPMLGNALNMMEQGNVSEVEKMVKNLCKEKGLNPDDVMKQTKNLFGM